MLLCEMELKAAHILLLLWMNIVTITADNEVLQTFNSKHSRGFQVADTVISDKDNNGIEPEVVIVSDQIVIRTETMPKWDDYNAGAIRENNYVYLPYITNPTGNEMVVLKYEYNHVASCPTNYVAQNVQCKDYVMLYLVPVDNNNIDMDTVDVMGTNIGSYKLATVTGDVSKTEHIDIQTNSTKGYRLVLHDEGSQFLVKTVSLTRYYCKNVPDPMRLPINCNDTSATNQRSLTTQCTCGDANSSPNNTRNFIEEVCVYDQSTSTALFSRASNDVSAQCQCKSGYIYDSQVPSGLRYCRVQTTVPPTTAPSATVAPSPPTAPSAISSSSGSKLSSVTQKAASGAGTTTTSSVPTISSSASKSASKVTTQKMITTSGASLSSISWCLFVVALLWTH